MPAATASEDKPLLETRNRPLLLVGMVRFGSFAGAQPGPGLLAFAATVVLTMLATHGFDPRWIWERADPVAADEAPGVRSPSDG